ncbi:MBL fold metallo-hydrolase [Gordonia soli]|uniref:Putative beta-lactamase n=1 Tax=Gordonia soli NBRC 108243 TaxID=1223545 RepID=M0QQT3_9ACTN|nr:MBL fold metallo-hydrolase [Gordonia soli]GAC70928.1 putative beta-lactamase [Gordonia soli NBRC 108243]
MSTFRVGAVEGDHSTAHLVYTDHVNWILLEEGSDLTLVDGGYPGNAADVVDSIRQIGRRPEDVRGALLTHAHVDHLGGLVSLSEKYGFPVYADPREVAHAHREVLHQAGPRDIAPMAYRPAVLRWLAGIIPLGALSRNGIPDAAPFPVGESAAIDLPGRPVPVAAHGHTEGHSGFLVGDGAVLVSGDALDTAHGISKLSGPQLLPACFHHDIDANRAAVESFTRLDATTLFPGHGPMLRGSVAEAAHRALDRD